MHVIKSSFLRETLSAFQDAFWTNLVILVLYLLLKQSTKSDILGLKVQGELYSQKVVETLEKSPYRVLKSIRILFNLFVFYGFLFNLVCEFRDWEPGVNPATIFFKSVVYKLVLILRNKHSFKTTSLIQINFTIVTFNYVQSVTTKRIIEVTQNQ